MAIFVTIILLAGVIFQDVTYGADPPPAPAWIKCMANASDSVRIHWKDRSDSEVYPDLIRIQSGGHRSLYLPMIHTD